MSFLALKKTPILGSILHVIILNCWRERRIPAIWKRGVTVLIYKRGDTSDPTNYRPITLQNCWYKIFSKVYASSIFEFLSNNKFIDTEYQKGFWRGVDGVLEHTEVLERMLKSAKKERRNIIVCLLDLKNAFGEIPHALLKSTLIHHHLPPEIIEIFESIYSDNMIKVSLSNSLTQPIRVERGVLQGDPASPLLFNICFNTLMHVLLLPRYKQLGFSYGNKGHHRQRAAICRRLCNHHAQHGERPSPPQSLPSMVFLVRYAHKT